SDSRGQRGHEPRPPTRMNAPTRTTPKPPRPVCYHPPLTAAMSTRTASERDREARRLTAFASTAAGLAQSEDLDHALADALRRTPKALDLDAGGIYLLDEATGELRATPHHQGLPPDYASAVTRFGKGESLISRALESGRPLVVPDIAAASEARTATRESGLRSIVFVPLYARGHAVGMMPVGGYALREFTE